jgi:hypothetical protein
MGMPRLGFRVLTIKQEPLANFHKWFYVYPMIEHHMGAVGFAMKRLKLITALLHIWNHMPFIKWLPGIPGHSLYVVLQKES